MRFPLALALLLTATSASAEPGWTVERSEVAYLFYGEPKAPLLTITCGEQEVETGKDETRIEVETEKGTTAKAAKVVLIVEMKGRRGEVPLKADICGPDNACTNLPDGEIYRYEASVPGKRLAVEIADRGERITIDAPGAKFSAPRDDKAFKKNSRTCASTGDGHSLSLPLSRCEQNVYIYGVWVKEGGVPMRAMPFVLVLFSLFAVLPAIADDACRCQGCGCKGGAGWRGPDGACVPRASLAQVCGSPAGAPCKQEDAKRVCFGKQSALTVPKAKTLSQ